MTSYQRRINKLAINDKIALKMIASLQSHTKPVVGMNSITLFLTFSTE